MKQFTPFILSLPFLLVACSSKPIPVAGSAAYDPSYTGYGTPSEEIEQNITPKVEQPKRIETQECDDADDWYLDGYRVATSYSAQKSAMYQRRLALCGYTENSLPNQFSAEWERGYQSTRSQY